MRGVDGFQHSRPSERRSRRGRFGAFRLWRPKTVSRRAAKARPETQFACDRDRLACKNFEQELGYDGQLGTVDRIAELLYCWCAPQMEDAMCYERDYRIFEDRKKAEDTRVVQERRAGLIDRLLDDANKHGEKTKAEGTPVKDVAPAK